MTPIVVLHNIGALLKPAIASAFVSATAAGTGDNTAVTGATVDRLNGSNGTMAGSAQFVVAWSAALAATKTLTLKSAKIEHSDDGSSWADYVTFTDPGVVATGPTGGGTVTGTTALNVDLNSAKRYVRLDFTPDLSATGTDTASLVAVAELGGFGHLPA